MIKVIKSDKDYKEALKKIESLMDIDPDIGTPKADQLELLTILVQNYESRILETVLPDPVYAIKFRIEQQNLKQRDLIPYIGSRSKVSEILSRRRPLTLSMIRALHSGLGIPAKVLLQGHDISVLNDTGIEWNKFPLGQMIARGWINKQVLNVQDESEVVLRRFFAPLGKPSSIVTLFRQTDHIRSARSMDDYALVAWTGRIIMRAMEDAPRVKYVPRTVNIEFMRNVARLSWSESGPLLAKEFLMKHGIPLIVEPHLPRTHLDGASILINSNMPIIGLTLRYDRIDNFWFSLMHELAHISAHIDEGIGQFYDDLDVDDQNDTRELEADQLAGEALIPKEAWEKSPASRLRSPEAAEHLAKQLGIHPAIVAGRMRYEFKAYRLLNNLVGHRQVRPLFSETTWS
ncbi:MAG: ImmA/IrrE family metallo-endopeptidase [Candidatus Marinimicrobia bacterium]|nr:ImmA/IrrE family metallo-endopeptidase [Candidatus Neomarinimicrobiota bacterium]